MNRVTSLATMTVLTLASAMSPASAAEINVTVVNGHPPVFLWVKHLSETFIPTVNAKLEGTQYKINWTEAYGGSLAAVGSELEAIEDGLAEVGVVPSVFEPTSLPLQNVGYFTPFGTPDARIVLEAVDKLHRQIPGMTGSWEKYNAEYLGGGFAVDGYVLMTDFPVSSIDDLRGRRIGAPGPAVNWLEGTGAVGVAANATTFYNDVQTGVLDGVLASPTYAAPAKLYEVAPYVAITDLGTAYAGSLVASKEWLSAQPQQVQDALRAGAEAYTNAYIVEQTQRVKSAMATLKEAGAKITYFTDAERVRWAEALPHIADVWAKDADAQGLPGSEVLDVYIGLLKEAGVNLARDWSQR